MGGATIQNRAPGRVTIGMSAPGQPPTSTDLVEIDGAWYIDGDTVMPMFTNLPPEQRQIMAGQAMASVGAIEDLIPRIEAGEFASPQEALQAMMQEVMKSMGAPGGAGGPGGMSPPGG
jgi:hypothetical protein